MATKQSLQQVERWGQFEVVLKGPADGNPFRDVELSAVFQYKNLTLEPDGFYDGNGIYRIRFSPDREGIWRYVTRSNCPELDGHAGEFVCVAPGPGNHGPVMVHNTYHFRYADGTPYRPFGTTLYHWTHHGDKEAEERTLRTLEQSPFNKVRMCVLPTREFTELPLVAFAGTTPDDLDKTRFNPAFFSHFERRITDLMKRGIQADIILFHPYDKGFWGVDNMTPEEDMFYLKYVIARLASFRNVWWSLSNEYDFNKFKTVEDWDRLIQFVQQRDPYQRLRSIHNGTKMYESSNLYDFTKPWITHQSIQHWDAKLTPLWRKQCKKPVVIDEISYEGNSSRRWGNITGEELVSRYWEAITEGAYVAHGETFNQYPTRPWISGGGVLYGDSPARIAFLRRIMEEGPLDLVEARERGEYILLYFGKRQAQYRMVELPEHSDYKVELIDTWNMTITPLEGTYRGKCRIELEGKPYMALRAVRISADGTKGGSR